MTSQQETPAMADQKENQSIYQLVTEGSLAGAYIIQEDRFVYVNARMARIFGYAAEDLMSGRVEPRDLVHPDDLALVRENLRQRLAGEVDSLHYTFRGQRRDGAGIYCEVLGNRVEYEGSPAVVGTLLDITARKRAEEDLQAQKSLLDKVFSSLPDLLVLKDRDFVFQAVNPAFCRYVGKAETEIIGQTDFDLFPGPEAERYRRDDARVLATGVPLVQDEEVSGAAGKKWLQVAKTPVFDEQGRPTGVLCAVRDISERHQMEEALRASEASYQTIFNAVDDGIAVVDLETGNFLDVNRKWCQMTGFSPEEARGLNVAVLCMDEPPFTGADALRWIKEASERGAQSFEYIARTKEGRRHWVEINLRRTVIGGQERLLAVVRDITERKQAEEALRTSEAKYRNLVEQIPAITYITAMDNLTGAAVYLSPQIKDILGFSPEEWQANPESYKKQLHPEDRDRVLTELLLSYSQGGPFFAEYRLLSSTGRVVWVRDESRAVYDSEGRPLFVQGVVVDISKRKKAEEALREANSKLQALVQASPLATIGLDLHGKVISWNPAAEHIFGWRRDEVISRPYALLPVEQKEEFKQLWQRLLQGEQLLGLELRRLKKDGSQIDVSLFSAPLYDAAGRFTGAIGVFEDITARKRTEEALRESEARFRAMFEGAPIGIFLIDLKTKIPARNQALREMGGYSDIEILHFTGAEVTHPDDWEADNILFTEMLAGKRSRFQKETRYLHKQGHWVWVRLSVSLVRDASGQPQFVICMMEDITERKRAEMAAEEIRRQQEAILSNIPDMAWLKDRESRYIVVNEQYSLACGVSRREVVGKTDLDLWPPNLAAKYRADDQEVLRSGKRKLWEEPVQDRQGNFYWKETVKTPIFNERGEVIGTAGIGRDITKRRQMEEALRQVSRALKAVTECHQALMRATNEAELLNEVCRIIVGVGGYKMAWVGYGRQDEGKSVEPVAQQGFDDGYLQSLQVTWADVKRGQGPSGTAIRTGKPAITRDTQSDPRFAPWREEARKRGFASILGLPLGDFPPFGALTIYAAEPNAFDDEEINLLIGLADDLSYGLKTLRMEAERRRVEVALRDSERKYWSLMDSANDAIILADSRGKITEVNRKVVELLGYLEEELLGMEYSQIHPSRILEHVMENFDRIIATGSGPLHECLVMRKDGEEVPVDIAHNMVENGDHRVVQAVFRDITERQRAEEALKDSEQKLRLLASQLLSVQEKERRRVSRELHDELGQALTVLKIHLVAIENKLHGDQEDLKASCEHLQSYIDTVIENVRRLSWDLSPSSLEDLGLSSSLKYLVEDICRSNHMLYSVAMDKIDNLYSSESRINIYRIFQESLTNIVRHAEASRIDVEIKKEKDRVTFRLKDDGKGFDVKKALSRRHGKRGLGLTALHERALMADGTLNIWSRKSKGTEITLTIPIRK